MYGQGKVYEYIEEADKRELMEILDAFVNRFRELHRDQELITMTLPVGDREKRRLCLDRILELIKEYENRSLWEGGSSQK